MKENYSEGFKRQAVQKAMQRAPGVTLTGLAEDLGCGYSTLQRWIRTSSQSSPGAEMESKTMTAPKSPHALSAAEKLEHVITCAGMDEQTLSAHCRNQGIYPHQLTQWKEEFAQGLATTEITSSNATKQLRNENKALKRELRRKEKALAEAAALLVLQKKLNTMWDDNEDDSP